MIFAQNHAKNTKKHKKNSFLVKDDIYAISSNKSGCPLFWHGYCIYRHK